LPGKVTEEINRGALGGRTHIFLRGGWSCAEKKFRPFLISGSGGKHKSGAIRVRAYTGESGHGK